MGKQWRGPSRYRYASWRDGRTVGDTIQVGSPKQLPAPEPWHARVPPWFATEAEFNAAKARRADVGQTIVVKRVPTSAPAVNCGQAIWG